MPTNWWMFLLAGLIPMVVGFLWYGDMLFGKKWMKVNGFVKEDLEGANMGLIFGLSYLFSVMIAFFLSSVVLHQNGVVGLLGPGVFESGSALQNEFNDIMSKHGGNFRTFAHGALHGGALAVFFVLPLIAINALFERRGWAYIWIHFGYWFICLLVMGGLLCQTLTYAPLT